MDLWTAALNESPSEKEGKSGGLYRRLQRPVLALNESPSEKEGKWIGEASPFPLQQSLNESPSEKEGKSVGVGVSVGAVSPSMKVPPKRKGNLR